MLAKLNQLRDFPTLYTLMVILHRVVCDLISCGLYLNHTLS